MWLGKLKDAMKPDPDFEPVKYVKTCPHCWGRGYVGSGYKTIGEWLYPCWSVCERCEGKGAIEAE